MADVTNPAKTSLGATVPLIITDVDGTNYANAVTVVGFADTVLDLTLTTDDSSHSANDVLAATQALAGAARVAGGTGVIQTIVVQDLSDQGVAMDLVFLDANVGIGTENAAVSVADSDAVAILGTVNIATTDYCDLINSQVATVRNVGLEFKCAAASTSLYVAAITRGGTPTYAATGLRLKIGILRG
jgi:hypothetical protein